MEWSGVTKQLTCILDKRGGKLLKFSSLCRTLPVWFKPCTPMSLTHCNCRNPGSNQGPLDLQSNALPTELFRHTTVCVIGYWGLDDHDWKCNRYFMAIFGWFKLTTSFVCTINYSCQKWDANPRHQGRLRPERSALDRSAILTTGLMWVSCEKRPEFGFDVSGKKTWRIRVSIPVPLAC